MTEVECPCCPARYPAPPGKTSTCPLCGVTVPAGTSQDSRASSYYAERPTAVAGIDRVIRDYHGRSGL